MSVIATVSVPAAEFTLGAALAPDPGLRVRLERVVPVSDTFIPYLWVANDAVADIKAELRQETDIEAFSIVDTVDQEALVRIEWAETVDGFITSLAETDATILDAIGEADGWRFQLRFDDHDQLTAFYQRCADRGITIDLESVHNPGVPREIGPDFDLTDAQHETLRLALERGYFDVPRQVTVVDLAEELDISDSAVSQRLRRGTESLLEAILAEGDAEQRG